MCYILFLFIGVGCLFFGFCFCCWLCVVLCCLCKCLVFVYRMVVWLVLVRMYVSGVMMFVGWFDVVFGVFFEKEWFYVLNIWFYDYVLLFGWLGIVGLFCYVGIN